MASVFREDRKVFSEFNLHIYENEILGMICDSVTEEQALLALFRGRSQITGTTRFSRKAPAKGRESDLFEEYFFIIGEQMNLISSFSIPENICIFSNRGFFIRNGAYQSETDHYLSEFSLSLDTSRPVSDLENKEKLLILLLKAHAEKRKIIVLYNISEKITEAEFAPVHELMKKLTAKGHSFVIIDSIETNIFNAADQVMVIRHGTSVACFDAAFFNRQTFYDYMLKGRPGAVTEDEPPDEYNDDDSDTPYLIFDRVSTDTLTDITFSAAKGELLKILCLDRKTVDGFRELINGTSVILQGDFLIGNKQFRRPSDICEAMKQGIAWCPESPYESAVIGTMSARDNLMLTLSGKISGIWMKNGFAENISQYIRQHLGIENPLEKAYRLSPDHLQRIVYARFLISAPNVLFVEKPFTETDVRIRETTLEMLKILLRRGMTIILLTSAPSTLSLIDGDEIYAKDGRIISEEEMYRCFYGS